MQREGRVLQRRLDLAQAAALAEHELADAAQLALREAGRVDVGEQVGAVAMVVVVRDHHARPRAAPPPRRARAAPRGSAAGAALSSSVERRRAPTRSRLRDVDLEAPLQLAHRGVAQVLAAGATLGRLARREVEDHALAQRAARRLQLGDAEVRRQRVEDREAAADDGAAVVLQAGQRELVGAAGLEALLHQPAQAVGRDAAVADAARGEHLRDRADGARRAERLAPVARRERLERFLELGAGGDLRLAKARAR